MQPLTQLYGVERCASVPFLRIACGGESHWLESGDTPNAISYSLGNQVNTTTRVYDKKLNALWAGSDRIAVLVFEVLGLRSTTG